MSSTAKKAGLTFPPSRFRRLFKDGKGTERIGKTSGVYAAAVIEYMMAEILELSGNAAVQNKKTRITPRHIQLAVSQDEELSKMYEGSVITDGGVQPNINPVLLPKLTKKRTQDRVGGGGGGGERAPTYQHQEQDDQSDDEEEDESDDDRGQSSNVHSQQY